MSILNWIFGKKETEKENHKEIFTQALNDLKLHSDFVNKTEEEIKELDELVKKCLLETDGGCEICDNIYSGSDVKAIEVFKDNLEIIKDFINIFKKDCILSYSVRSNHWGTYVKMFAKLKNHR